ncbi:tRNA (guanine-N(7)-)-methyltransferase non-catalytic subunit TRM82 [Hypsizygus marmoreus]|uniref:tRNA (Guanine-N(7)-)-methyltransferase non-catalytic subunit TRM82 n=1 Tax=Hypsizygus marmoreus TaxID=39966 RepID=A0A369JWB6_HYPMA|nr:tRNA (guanine-N(7)-)-methyltransferase non-catalytic subunit TRM82 [Hypsizygus marmoreus]
MSTFPHSHLFPGPSLTIVISGPHIQVLSTSTGDVLHTTAATKSGPIRCAAVDSSGRYLATSGEDKMLKVWEVEGLGLLSERELPKRPTAVRFTADAQTILASDKFGDVFSYPFHFTPPLTANQQKDALSSHENPSGGKLILGHASLLTAFLLTADEKYIITADRDEHIRVSWFPQGYNIEMYCLGHTKFVSAIHNPSFSPGDLISGGGDPVLKIWDWMTGKVKHEIEIWETVEPYVKVRGSRRRRGGEDGEEGNEGKRRGKGKKSKGKGKGKAKTEVDKETKEAEAVEETEDVVNDAEGSAAPEHSTDSDGDAEKVLVVRKIDTVTSGDSRYIVFNAVGATALFIAQYPEEGVVSGVRAFDLGQPVLDFVVADDGLIWVSLDGNWSESGLDSTAGEPRFIRVLDVLSGELVDRALDSPLLASLNAKCLLPAYAEDLKRLDLYGDLTSMPKNTSEGDQDQGGDTPLPSEGTPPEKPVNKKVLGRLKNKRAVLDKVQEIAEQRTSTPTGEDEARESDTKKAKSEHGDEPGHNTQDVVMGDE